MCCLYIFIHYNFTAQRSCPRNTIILDFCGNISIPKPFATFCSVILFSVNYPLNQLLRLYHLQREVCFTVVDKVIYFVQFWFHLTIILFRYMLNNAGDKAQPCLKLWLIVFSCENWLFIFTCIFYFLLYTVIINLEYCFLLFQTILSLWTLLKAFT
jgi:hypothetical protein